MDNDLIVTSKKLQQLEKIASGEAVNADAVDIKSKIAMFLVAHADKVMDTVAPLECLREELSKSYIESIQERLDDPELTPGQLARMISDIQYMNQYSINMLRDVLDADKLQSLITVNNTTHVDGSTNNILNLNTAASRSRVTRALQQIMKLSEEEGDYTIDTKNK